MPELNSSAITCEYSLKVVLAKCFRIETSNIKVGQLFKKVPKTKLYQELEQFVHIKELTQGFSLEKLPDKKQLFNVLHILDENNEIFQKIVDHEKVIGLTKDDLKQQFLQYDTYIGRKKNYKFFKRTQQQVQEKKTCLQNKSYKIQNQGFKEGERNQKKMNKKQDPINIKQSNSPNLIHNNGFRMLQYSKNNKFNDIYIVSINYENNTIKLFLITNGIFQKLNFTNC